MIDRVVGRRALFSVRTDISQQKIGPDVGRILLDGACGVVSYPASRFIVVVEPFKGLPVRRVASFIYDNRHGRGMLVEKHRVYIVLSNDPLLLEMKFNVAVPDDVGRRVNAVDQGLFFRFGFKRHEFFPFLAIVGIIDIALEAKRQIIAVYRPGFKPADEIHQRKNADRYNQSESYYIF